MRQASTDASAQIVVAPFESGAGTQATQLGSGWETTTGQFRYPMKEAQT